MYRDKMMTGVQSKWRRTHLRRAYPVLSGVFGALSSSVVEDDRHTKDGHPKRCAQGEGCS